MSFLLPLLILAAGPADLDDYAEAVEVFSCDFEAATDANFDGWPDHWTRRRGRGFPQYVAISIVDEETVAVEGGPSQPSGNRCLRIELDGGAAAAFSPLIEVSPQFSYILEGRLKTENLKHNVAYYTLTFFDADRNPLETYSSPHCRNVQDWKTFRIGPISPAHPGVRLAVIGLRLHPTESSDLTGAAMFDDIWFARLPRMTLSSNSDHNVYPHGGDVNIVCHVSGVAEPEAWIEFELLDRDGRTLSAAQRRLQGEPVKPPLGLSPLVEVHFSGYAGAAAWTPPIPGEGFYRVRASLRTPSGAVLQRVTSLAVIRPELTPADGEFGWSLRSDEHPLALNSLADLLGQVGIRWVKAPIGRSAQDAEQLEQLARFAERLSGRGVQMVGVLNQPPGEITRLPIVPAFVPPDGWRQAVTPEVAQLSLAVRWWQLGGDGDAGLVGLPDLEAAARDVKQRLDWFGRGIHLGLAWPWLAESPDAAGAPWTFLSYMTEPQTAPEELETHLAAEQASPMQRWVTLQPLPRSQHSLETRVRDLVARMLAAKVRGAEAIFVADPFSGEHGLMDGGSPSELWMPWRTTALTISGAQYLGQIRFPQGSHNYVFARGQEAVIVIWNERPTTETIYLGENVQQIDLWGRTKTPELSNQDGMLGQQIEVDTLPTFLIGANLAIARWRMAVRFDPQQIPSLAGRKQTASCRFHNSFDQDVTGRIVLHTPPTWVVQPRQMHFALAAGQEWSEAFELLLRPGAPSGEQPIRADFEISADQNYRFSVHQSVQVGLHDVVVALDARLNENGELVVKQQFTNNTDALVSFDCLLFIPNRRRERQQIVNRPRGRTANTYVLPDGEKLVGKVLWLRAEEIGGDRILNYYVTAKR